MYPSTHCPQYSEISWSPCLITVFVDIEMFVDDITRTWHLIIISIKMEGGGAYGAGKATGQFDYMAYVKKPQVIIRAVSLVSMRGKVQCNRHSRFYFARSPRNKRVNIAAHVHLFQHLSLTLSVFSQSHSHSQSNAPATVSHSVSPSSVISVTVA